MQSFWILSKKTVVVQHYIIDVNISEVCCRIIVSIHSIRAYSSTTNKDHAHVQTAFSVVCIFSSVTLIFYRAMRYSAKRSPAIAFRLSVNLSLCNIVFFRNTCPYHCNLTMIGWRNVWSMKWTVPGQEVDQRKLGEILRKQIVRCMDWTGRMPWIIVDGWSRYATIGDHDRCKWMNVSSGTGSPGLSRTKCIES